MSKWVDYITNVAAPHSRGCAEHWFRYLRKNIDDCGMYFTMDDVETLCNDERLTMFQRVSLKMAFVDGSPTREHIQGLNKKYVPSDFLERMREKYG
jgi:hypothetical protein